MWAPSGSICPAPPLLLSFSSKVRSSISQEAGLLLILSIDIISLAVLIDRIDPTSMQQKSQTKEMQYFPLGPCKFQKLAIGSKAFQFQVHHAEPIFLVSTSDQKLQELYLRDLDTKNVLTHALPMKALHSHYPPDHFCFSQKNILHCEDDLLKINNRQEINHKGRINHLLADQHNIAVTSAEDCLYVTSVAKGEIEAELKYYGETITSVFWRNSLILSGDARGNVNLWDINKQTIVNSNLIHAARVDFISAYVDYIHTNLYYTLSRKEKRITFHDLRTYKPIKITSNLPGSIVDVQHNNTGKIFLTTEKEVQFIDIYQGFSPTGKFSAISSEDLECFLRNNQNAEFQSRRLTSMLIWDQYLIVGADNGCIEVYDSDLLQCLYSYGVCEFSGVKKMRRIGNSLIVLEEKGLMSAAKLC